MIKEAIKVSRQTAKDFAAQVDDNNLKRLSLEKKYGEVLRLARLRAHLTQSQLAQSYGRWLIHFGVNSSAGEATKGAISYMERKNAVPGSITRRKALAHAVGVPFGVLFASMLNLQDAFAFATEQIDYEHYERQLIEIANRYATGVGYEDAQLLKQSIANLSTQTLITKGPEKHRYTALLAQYYRVGGNMAFHYGEANSSLSLYSKAVMLTADLVNEAPGYASDFVGAASHHASATIAYAELIEMAAGADTSRPYYQLAYDASLKAQSYNYVPQDLKANLSIMEATAQARLAVSSVSMTKALTTLDHAVDSMNQRSLLHWDEYGRALDRLVVLISPSASSLIEVQELQQIWKSIQHFQMTQPDSNRLTKTQFLMVRAFGKVERYDEAIHMLDQAITASKRFPSPTHYQRLFLALAELRKTPLRNDTRLGALATRLDEAKQAHIKH